jgi:hypothetical protein
MPASIIIDPVMGILYVNGNKMLIVEIGPSPGNSPINVPIKHPIAQYNRLFHVSAVANPASRWVIISIVVS